jgi:hypothetical protein
LEIGQEACTRASGTRVGFPPQAKRFWGAEREGGTQDAIMEAGKSSEVSLASFKHLLEQGNMTSGAVEEFLGLRESRVDLQVEMEGSRSQAKQGSNANSRS